MKPVYPMGVRFWAQHFKEARRFEVFEYIAHDVNRGLYWFKARSGGARISRSFRQLNANGFRPFCYITERLPAAILDAAQARGV